MTKRNFAPVDVLSDSDDEQKIRTLAAEKGVPDHAKAVRAVTTTATPAEPEVPLSTTVPKYVADALKMNAAKGEGSIRFQLLTGLKASGLVDVNDDDLAKDRRGAKPKARG